MENTDHLTLADDEVPMPQTVEGVLSTLRNILNKPYVQSIRLSQGEPIKVSWYRDLSDSLRTVEPEESVDSVLSRVDLKEISGNYSLKELLVDGMMRVSISGEYPSHLLVGNIDTFRDLLGIPQMISLPEFDGTGHTNFAGMPLIEVTNLQADSVVLLASGVRGAKLSEVKSGIKLTT